MIFVDSNVFMYAVGRPHPLQHDARDFFASARIGQDILVTSAEVLQELLHAYLPVQRMETLDAALALARARVQSIWAVEPEDVLHARLLADSAREVGARDLLHLAACQRRGVSRIHSFDRALLAAAGRIL